MFDDSPNSLPSRALMVRQPYVSFILSSRKRWELRGTPTNIRGRIGLIASGSGMIFGECVIEDCLGPLNFDDLSNSCELTREERSELKMEGRPPYLQKDGVHSKTYAWVVSRPRVYMTPVPYKHPSGAITFVDLTKAGILECSEASPSKAKAQLELF